MKQRWCFWCQVKIEIAGTRHPNFTGKTSNSSGATMRSETSWGGDRCGPTCVFQMKNLRERTTSVWSSKKSRFPEDCGNLCWRKPNSSTVELAASLANLSRHLGVLCLS
jgi:hypothetical protein